LIIDHKIKSKKLAVLIPDGEWEKLSNHVINCLSEYNDICLYVMSNRKYIPSRYSRFVKGFTYNPKTDDPSLWINSINKVVRKHEIDLILPVYEDGIGRLIKYKGQLHDPNKLVILPSLSFFETARSKLKLAAHLAKHGIPGPRIFILKSDSDITNARSYYPIIAKPVEGTTGGRGILLFNDEITLLEFLKNKNEDDPKLVFQEYIKGYDIDCSVLCREGNIEAFTIQKGTLYDTKNFSPPIGIQFVYESRLYDVVAKLMRTLNWSGVAHVDLRYDMINNEYKVIEVNCRFWGTLDASLLAGVNFPYLYCLLTLNKEFKLPKYRHIPFLNLKAIVRKVRSNVLFLFKFNFIWNYTALKFLIKDPFPVFIKILQYIK